MAGLFVRFESPVPDHRGRRVGVFGLINGLARSGELDEAEEASRRRANDWYDEAYANPADADPLVYDRAHHPLAAAWFTVAAAGHLVDRVGVHLALLDAHDVAWHRVTSDDPGRVVYEDDVQVVVVPHPSRR